jgi:polyisoprenoid-binding protein YceI
MSGTTDPRLMDTLRITTLALPTGTWTLDTAASTASFVATELWGKQVHGTIPLTSGSVRVDDDGRPAEIEAVLDMTALKTDNARRDKDLKAKRFFDVAASPTMRFSAHGAQRTDRGWSLDGSLRVNGHESPITLEVRIDPPLQTGQETARVLAHGRLDKRNAGVRAPSWLIRHPVAVEIAATLRLL